MKKELRRAITKVVLVWTIFFICPVIMLTVSVVGIDKFTKKDVVVKRELTQEEYDFWYTDHDADSVLITWYNPVESQCDDDPLITADLSKIDLSALKRRDIRWIAVSRDLLEAGKYQMGDTVFINSPNEKINGEWVIHDKMNSRFTKRIDLLVSKGDTYYNLKMPKQATIKKV